MPEMKYVMFRAGTQPNGGFYLVKKMPAKGQVNVYIEVEDIDAKLKEIKKAEGKVLVKKTQSGKWVVRPVRHPRRVLPLALAGQIRRAGGRDPRDSALT